MKTYKSLILSRISALLFVVTLFGTFNAKAQQVAGTPTTVPSTVKEEVDHNVILNLMYQMCDFDAPKLSGLYGFNVTGTSFYHNGNIHVGANFSILTNYGIVNDGGLAYGLGPNFRFDLTKNVFINIPLDVMLGIAYHTEDLESKTDTSWGFNIAPSIYAFFSKNLGVFIGPGVTFAKSSSVGMQCGVAISF